MSENKFTPGPWIANNFHSGHSLWRVESDANGYVNDGWHIAVEIPGPDAEYNAQLIAAAPDLLEALEYAVNLPSYAKTYEEIEKNWNAWETKARAAIAKARGIDNQHA